MKEIEYICKSTCFECSTWCSSTTRMRATTIYLQIDKAEVLKLWHHGIARKAWLDHCSSGRHHRARGILRRPKPRGEPGLRRTLTSKIWRHRESTSHLWHRDCYRRRTVAIRTWRLLSAPASPTSLLPPCAQPERMSPIPRAGAAGRVPQRPEYAEACHAMSRARIKSLTRGHAILVSLLVVLLLVTVVGVPLGLLLGKDSDTDGQGKNNK